MTDLISREAAIAVLTERKNECPLESVQRYVLAAAIEALTNMPSAKLTPRHKDWGIIYLTPETG
jgi:hypothetical protein